MHRRWCIKTQDQSQKASRKNQTEVARFLAFYDDAVVISGAGRHILATAYKRPAPIYIMIEPRATNQLGISYTSLELLKDSLYHSGCGTQARMVQAYQAGAQALQTSQYDAAMEQFRQMRQ